MNIIKTGFLMTLMTMLFIFIGGELGGRQGVIIALGFAVVMNFFSYWFSDKAVLAFYKAKEVDRNQAPELYDIVERLAKKADLPTPRVCIIPSEQPNAFATGRNPEHAVVAATEGLLRMLDRSEIEAVIAHELAHIKHRDILIATIVATFAGAISSIAWFVKWGAIFGGMRGDDEDGGGIGGLVLAIVAPIIALIIQMAISRSREYHADQFAGELTGNPRALASALERLHLGAQQIPMQAGPATAHMWISSPLSGKSLAGLFSTHPSMEDRIEKLLELEKNMKNF